MIDATEPKRAETALAESQLLLGAMINCTTHMIWAVEPATLGLVSFNQSFVDFCREEFGVHVGRGMRPEDLLPTETLAKTWHELYRRAMQEGSYTTIYRTAIGRKTLQLSFNPLNRDGALLGIAVFARDVTERTRAEEAMRESKEKFQALVESTSDFIWEVDTQARYTYCSPQIKELWGYEPQEMIGKTPFDQMAPEGREQTRAVFRAVAETPRPVKGMQVSSLDSSGRDVCVEISFVPIWDNDQRLCGFRGISRDITERKRAEELLRRSEEKYSKLFHASPEAIVLTNPKEGRFIEVNDSFPKLFGYTRAETIGHTVFELSIWDDLQVRERLLGLIDQGIPVRNVEVNFRGKDRRLIPCDFSCETVEINGARCLLGIIQDISGRQQVEQALRASEETYRTVVENAGIGIVIVLGDTIAYANPCALDMIGAPREEVVGSSFTALVHPGDLPGVLALHARLLAGHPTPPVYELRLKVAGQGEKWVQANTVPYQWGGKPGTLNFLTDITEQRRAEQALRESEARFRTFVEQASEGIALTDEQGRIAAWNKVMEEISGIPRLQAVGRPVWDVQWQMTPVDHLPPLGVDAFKAAFARGLRTGDLPQAGKRTEIEVQSTNGERRAVEQIAFSVKTDIGYRFGSVVLDITERKRAEAEREQLLGQVQVAHEQLQALSRRLVQVQEEERRNIARELHDEIGQVLTGLKLMLDTSLRLPPEVISGRLQQAQVLVGQLIDQVQELSLDLRPTMLDDYGLMPVLIWHLGRFKAQTGIDVAFEQHGLEQRLPPEVETAAYRIAQEALTNVARHAAVKQATLSLRVEGEELRVCIADHGRGFDVKTIVAAGTSTGLSGMRERASALGGRLMVEGVPGGGTRITAVLPFNPGLSRPVERR